MFFLSHHTSAWRLSVCMCDALPTAARYVRIIHTHTYLTRSLPLHHTSRFTHALTLCLLRAHPICHSLLFRSRTIPPVPLSCLPSVPPLLSYARAVWPPKAAHTLIIRTTNTRYGSVIHCTSLCRLFLCAHFRVLHCRAALLHSAVSCFAFALRVVYVL